jgi:hypothetical protein
MAFAGAEHVPHPFEDLGVQMYSRNSVFPPHRNTILDERPLKIGSDACTT